jgi:uncharacterized protein (DUF2461 family)
MSFNGFPKSTFDFYRALAQNNTNEFWRGHKPEYMRVGWEQMQIFLDSLPEFGEGRPLSPHRDRRTQGTQPPIKEYLAGRIPRVEGIWFYVELTVEGLLASGGIRSSPSSDQVARMRAAIAAPGSGRDLEVILDDLGEHGFDVIGEQVKTAPRGYPKDHPRIALLRFRTLSAELRWPEGRWVRTPEVLDRVRQAWTRCLPLVDWLERHVGAPA